MDPATGELWGDEQLAELKSINDGAERELRERLVRVEGSEEALSLLSANVARGAATHRHGRELSELEALARERAREAHRKVV